MRPMDTNNRICVYFYVHKKIRTIFEILNGSFFLIFLKTIYYVFYNLSSIENYIIKLSFPKLIQIMKKIIYNFT